MPRYALFATTQATIDGTPTVCFRVGLPTTLSNAHARHERFDQAHYYGRVRFGVQVASATLEVAWWEVREVDERGRGIGSERHFGAIPILVHDVQPLPEREHTLYVERNGYGAHPYTATVETDNGIAQGTGAHPMTAQSMARLNARKSNLI